MILQTMLSRLYASLARGPGLNARPHRSRQRIDLMELAGLGDSSPANALAKLLSVAGKTVEFPAKIPPFKKPEYPESEWSDNQRAASKAWERQNRLLNKLRQIASDANDYYNDHGENALYLGFPLISIPASGQPGDALVNKSILAPVLLAPINLRVRTGSRQGVSLELSGEGADLVIPNPALLAWIEQQTGENTDDLFADEAGEDPWREIAEVLALVTKATGLKTDSSLNADTPLVAIPKNENLPDTPSLLSSAVLGLFPITNPGLLRDTKWMISAESELKDPVRRFISPQALDCEGGSDLPPASEWDHSSSNATPSAPEACLVTHADPCQTTAVLHARASDALVIHGPPGTGKSQTIANIIGDHLARGQRVLFVCDKRTALDVVKYRLDGMGIGHLCGVIHDPQHDRKALYMMLRERLEKLTEAGPTDPTAQLDRVSRRLTELRSELRATFDKLHGRAGDESSFHETVGLWFKLDASGAVTLSEQPGLTEAMLESGRTDAEEILRRAHRIAWHANPYKDRVGIDVGSWLAINHDHLPAELGAIHDAASQSDALHAPDLPTPAPESSVPWAEQANLRASLAEQLQAIATRGDFVVARATANGLNETLINEVNDITDNAQWLDHPLDRELVLASNGTSFGLAAINQHLAALNAWKPITGSIKAWFAFGPKKAAKAALAPFGLGLDAPALERAENHYQGLRSRLLWSDQRARLLGEAPTIAYDDRQLQNLRDGLVEIATTHELLGQPAGAPLRDLVTDALRTASADTLNALVGRLRQSASHIEALLAVAGRLSQTTLFDKNALQTDLASWLAGAPAAPLVAAWQEAWPTFDDAVRLTERIGLTPAPLARATLEAATTSGEWSTVEPSLRAAALANHIRQRLREDQTLARVDTERVEAAFAELADRTAEHQHLVRAGIDHRWERLSRDRLLSTTGTRLNPIGASLRQRLFVRGSRALKLRQMIAAGASPGQPDPLFDLCPVWMAGPATVAQIFPREPLFDVIVFDEASQCRLEEALPVLLRGKRVVVAGDPKQLPPTRFFEQSLSESDDHGAETVDEVFEQQQSDAEDLLTAALNLDVQEAFLDVHYRSRNEALIGFSNDAFYSSRLQPVPGHPRNKALATPIRLVRVDGRYEDRGNPAEATAAATLVDELLRESNPPSIGIACFNLPQRDLIIAALDEKAAADADFAARLDLARKRRGRDSFEGLFVKNLENVQGDERDHMIICTTFGPNAEGKFSRNFGALSRTGGERRLNVLVTRARDAVHVLTSIPRMEYLSGATAENGRLTGRHQLYAYLNYAERLAGIFEDWQDQLEAARRDEKPTCQILETTCPSAAAIALGETLLEAKEIGSTVHWGNEGFQVDTALTHPSMPQDVTIGVLVDFNRYRKTPDPIAWELFRTLVLRSQGWELHRVWTPTIFRSPTGHLDILENLHRKYIEASKRNVPDSDPAMES